MSREFKNCFLSLFVILYRKCTVGDRGELYLREGPRATDQLPTALLARFIRTRHYNVNIFIISKLSGLLKVTSHWWIQGEGNQGRPPPLGPHFSFSYGLLGKLAKNNRLVPPPLWLTPILWKILDPPLLEVTVNRANCCLFSFCFICTGGIQLFLKSDLLFSHVSFWNVNNLFVS